MDKIQSAAGFDAVKFSPVFILGAIVLVIYRFYRAILPKPFPGIPYNKEAAKSLLGDMPKMVGHINETQEMYDWLSTQNVKLNSPIVQIFSRPFSKPWVVLSDFRETQDILMRRTKEFDRSDFTADLFHGLMPDHHIRLKTNDEYKGHRRLLTDLMTPGFLNKVAAPQVYESTMRLVNVWKEKNRLGGGRFFSATKDVNYCALDAVMAFTFGPSMDLSANQPQLDYLSSLSSLPPSSGDNDSAKPVDFPSEPLNPYLEAMFTLSNSLETSMKAPTPKLAHWFLRQTKSMKTARKYKEEVLAREIAASEERVKGGSHDYVLRCAVDDMVRREISLAAKEGREPAIHTRVFCDELFGFILGGHETTSNSNLWAVKILANHQAEQNKLRDSLRAAMPAAVAEGRMPTSQEITSMQCPYLDASIEELFRVSLTAPACVRMAMRDTEILGHQIPKSTIVFMVWNQADYVVPGFPVEERLRSESCRATEKRVGVAGDVFDTAAYMPERWLAKSEDGKEVFDATRGRNMIFSLGPRGCFGRRLAYVEFRMLVVLVVWNFQLNVLPPEYNTTKAYDKLTRQPQDCYVKLSEVV